MTPEMQEKLKKFLRPDGTYNTHPNVMSVHYGAFSAPKQFEVGDVVRLQATEHANIFTKRELGEPKIGVITDIFLTRSNTTKVMNWNYVVTLEQINDHELRSGDIWTLTGGENTIAVEKSDAQITLRPPYNEFKDTSSSTSYSYVTEEEYRAARDHNKVIEAAREAEKQQKISRILEKEDVEITEAEWYLLQQEGLARQHYVRGGGTRDDVEWLEWYRVQ